MHDLVADRVAELERSDRRLRRWLFVLTSALVIVLPLALVVGMFFMPFMVVRNAVSRKAVYVSTFGDAAAMAFQNKPNERRMELGVVRSGSPTLHLLGRDELPRIALWVDENEIPALLLSDPSRSAHSRQTSRQTGDPRFGCEPPSGRAGLTSASCPMATL